MVPKHLALLQAMFPNALMLDINQIAQLLRYGSGHLYNLNSEGRLPFKVSRGTGNKILVSIVEMAAYLDRTMLSEYEAPAEQPAALTVKKRGRPRGSSNKARSEAQAFQSDLHVATYRLQGTETLASLRRSVSDAVLTGTDIASCEERVQRIADHLAQVIEEAQCDFDRADRLVREKNAPPMPLAQRQYPFFADSSEFVLCLAVDEERVNQLPHQPPAVVCWMTWDKALTRVWLDEAERMRWMETVESLVPGVRDAVQQRRHAMLARI